MAELEQGLEELKVVKQAFKENIQANNVSTSNVEFRNMPDLLKQMEKKMPTQTKSVEPTKYPQSIKADSGYKLDSVEIREIPSQYIIPSGTKEITENNEYDVTEYSKVKVQVENAGTGTSGNPKFSQLIDGTIETIDENDLSEPTSIKDYTFYYCKNLTSAVVPSNITSIGASAFEGCSSLQTLVIADGVQNIGASAFKGINASIINIPSAVSVLESEVFANNPALTSIIIPSTITEIKDYVFNGCTNLTEITMESYVPISVTENTFPANVTAIYVKYGAYDDYVNMWTNYGGLYVDKLVRLPSIPSTITVTVNNYLGEFINGAVVTIEGNGQTFTGITDDNGIFVQGDLQPATYTISVAEIDGFKTPASQEIIVTENTQNNVVFTYLEKPAILPFAECSAEQISAISAEISAQNMTSAQVAETYGWNLGDKTTIPLSTGENIEMQIIGFNHDDKSDGSGKAGITLQMVNALATRYTMDDDKAGYPTSIMRLETLPTIKSTLPQEWQNVIKLVDKKSAPDSGYDSVVTAISEELFLLAEIEVFGVITYAYKGKDEGNIYEYWNGKTDVDRIKQYDTNADGVVDTATVWWLRSSRSGFPTMACAVSRLGKITYSTVSSNNLVSFAFCV